MLVVAARELLRPPVLEPDCEDLPLHPPAPADRVASVVELVHLARSRHRRPAVGRRVGVDVARAVERGAVGRPDELRDAARERAQRPRLAAVGGQQTRAAAAYPRHRGEGTPASPRRATSVARSPAGPRSAAETRLRRRERARCALLSPACRAAPARRRTRPRRRPRGSQARSRRATQARSRCRTGAVGEARHLLHEASSMLAAGRAAVPALTAVRVRDGLCAREGAAGWRG